MPPISRFFGIVIAMFYADHNPPHFHARYGDQEAVVEIDTLALVAGELSPKARALVVEWHQCTKPSFAKTGTEPGMANLLNQSNH